MKKFVFLFSGLFFLKAPVFSYEIVFYAYSDYTYVENILSEMDDYGIDYDYFDMNDSESYVSAADNLAADYGLVHPYGFISSVMEINGEYCAFKPTIDEIVSQIESDYEGVDLYETVYTGIQLFGRYTCGNCISLKNDLLEEDVDFDFIDIDESSDNYNEMWNWVYAAGWYDSGSVTLPIVVVDNHEIFSNPDLDEVLTSASDGETWVGNTGSSCSDGSCDVSIDFSGDADLKIYGYEDDEALLFLKEDLDLCGVEYLFLDIEESENSNAMMDFLEGEWTPTYVDSLITVYDEKFFFFTTADCILEMLSDTNETIHESINLEMQIIIYGADWCCDSGNMQRALDGENVPYTYINIDESTELKKEMWSYVRQSYWYEGGSVALPVVVIGDTYTFSNPQVQRVIDFASLSQ